MNWTSRNCLLARELNLCRLLRFVQPQILTILHIVVACCDCVPPTPFVYAKD